MTGRRPSQGTVTVVPTAQASGLPEPGPLVRTRKPTEGASTSLARRVGSLGRSVKTAHAHLAPPCLKDE